MSRIPAVVLPLCMLGAASCGYYNGMWSANHFAAAARRQERDGRRDEARASWAAAAVKAESVMVHHPHGRWTNAALVLNGEGLAKSGACDRAAAPLARALASVQDPALRERAALAAAQCDLDAKRASAAEHLLQPLTTSPRRDRASRAAYLSGLVAEQRGDLVAAAGSYAQSAEAQAGPARARVLLAAGQTSAALALIDTLAHGRFDESAWTQLLAAVGDGVGVAEASRVLDHVLAAGHIVTGSRARLLLADGNRLLGGDSLAAADARYQQVAVMVPDSSQGQVAMVRRLRVAAAQAGSVDELRSVRNRVDHLAQAGMAGAAVTEAHALQRLIQSVLDPEESGDAPPFQAAELARDSLRAPRLAVNVLLSFAHAHPASLFTPKALVAAAGLSLEWRDSLIAVLHSSYGASPYALALWGEPSPGYAAAEDSLARALGGVLYRPAASVASLIAPPVPGQRGPPLDPAGPERAEPSRLPGRPEPSRVPGRVPVRGDDAPRGDLRRPAPVQP